MLDLVALEQEREDEYLKDMEDVNEKTVLRASTKHKELMKQLLASPPTIDPGTVHGFMIDAGSTGSRIHLYEWEPRALSSQRDVEDAVAGRKLSFPTSQSRWSDRLRPGLATFAEIEDDDELVKEVSGYLSPLLEFAKMILREKGDQFNQYPIFLRATAGMRTLNKTDRFRVLDAVRKLFNDKSFCPFYFEDEFARVLSGEEEAVFGWAGTNFVLGNLLSDSQGQGTVLNPKHTVGALDMGGASTQISFYESHDDIMSGLFKLQIGQGKHWNLYAHSFLYFGMNEARDRMVAKLMSGSNVTSRLVDGVHNPCMPGFSRQEIRLDIYYDDSGRETWDDPSPSAIGSGYYQGILKNDDSTGDFDACLQHTKDLLNLEDNRWCNFAHRRDCSFNGVYMPEMPHQSEQFGEFIAISNYFHVWDFLGLPSRASLHELYNKTRHVCNMDRTELRTFNKHHAKVPESDIDDYCFRSAYVFNVLHSGYGFGMDEYVTSAEVLHGQKIGWALGAMLYEINTFPWKYNSDRSSSSSLIDRQNTLSDKATDGNGNSTFPRHHLESFFLVMTIVGLITATIGSFVVRSRRRAREQYSVLK